jgi:hypothetical protein
MADDPLFFVLRYEDLVARPDEVLDQIAAFTGVFGLNCEVMKHRVNSVTGDYVPPVELSQGELGVIQKVAQSVTIS